MQSVTFVPQIDQAQQDLCAVLSEECQALLAWAWLRRKTLRWSSADLLAAIPEDWRGAVRVLLAAWDDAVRVSSAVERYHSILRPHLAVHRTLSSEMLALIAVWHNHRVFSRGVHKGKNPLQALPCIRSIRTSLIVAVALLVSRPTRLMPISWPNWAAVRLYRLSAISYQRCASSLDRPASMMASPSRSCSSLMHSGGLTKKVFQRTKVNSPCSRKKAFNPFIRAISAGLGL